MLIYSCWLVTLLVGLCRHGGLICGLATGDGLFDGEESAESDLLPLAGLISPSDPVPTNDFMHELLEFLRKLAKEHCTQTLQFLISSIL